MVRRCHPIVSYDIILPPLRRKWWKSSPSHPDDTKTFSRCPQWIQLKVPWTDTAIMKWGLSWKNYSSYQRMIRIHAWIQRFISNLRKSQNSRYQHPTLRYEYINSSTIQTSSGAIISWSLSPSLTEETLTRGPNHLAFLYDCSWIVAG